MSEEIIKVLNYICEQLGIAIDWTAENVWPQVLDVFGRYRMYEIVVSIIWITVFIIFAICFIHFGKVLIKNYKSCCNNHDENLWFYYSNYCGEVRWNGVTNIYVTLLVFYLALAFIFVPIDIGNILQWALIPEIKILELLKGYIQ